MHKLHDPWVLDPNYPRTSYHSPSSAKRKAWSARLDRSYVTPCLRPKVVECHILPLISTLSDHSANRIVVSMTNEDRGPGYWKLNNSLLLHHKFVKAVRSTIQNLSLDDDFANQWADFKKMVKQLALKFGSCVTKENRNKSDNLNICIISQLSSLSSLLNNDPGNKIL